MKDNSVSHTLAKFATILDGAAQAVQEVREAEVNPVTIPVGPMTHLVPRISRNRFKQWFELFKIRLGCQVRLKSLVNRVYH